MTTDTDRREVARRLRDEVGCGSSWPGMERLGLILGIKREPRTGWEGRILTRLADLIDPGDTSQGCRNTVACDRDALLALADELSGDTLAVPAVYGTYVSGYVAACRDVASRIREALGVQDA